MFEDCLLEYNQPEVGCNINVQCLIFVLGTSLCAVYEDRHFWNLFTVCTTSVVGLLEEIKTKGRIAPSPCHMVGETIAIVHCQSTQAAMDFLDLAMEEIVVCMAHTQDFSQTHIWAPTAHPRVLDLAQGTVPDRVLRVVYPV